MPAQPFSFTSNVGVVFASRRSAVSGTFCHDCALHLGRKTQNRTMMTGWWGLISFFINFAAVVGNSSALRKAGALGAATGGDPGRRLDPGKPVIYRSGIVVVAAIVAVVTIFFATDLRYTADSRNGKCVNIYPKDGSIKNVPCSGPHSGKVIKVAASERDCPPETDFVGEDDGGGGDVICIEDDA